MQHLRPIPEEEMIATFLRTELTSSRFEQTILSILERNNRDRSVIEEPDLSNPADNRYRAQVLSEYRGYGRDRDVFTSVPDDVHWYRAQVTKADLARVRYIDYDYWTELSGGSRLAVDAAERVRQGIEVFGVGNGGFWYMAEALKTGATFPELILVGAVGGGPLVLLEGHVRLTSYFLAPECIPPLLPVIVGYALGLDQK
ncbi:MAG: hypothetical protein JOZ41_01315 [Chloroflexi bacterium]|nr:hypothetical protein [Chloroflexota bacterium]